MGPVAVSERDIGESEKARLVAENTRLRSDLAASLAGDVRASVTENAAPEAHVARCSRQKQRRRAARLGGDGEALGRADRALPRAAGGARGGVCDGHAQAAIIAYPPSTSTLFATWQVVHVESVCVKSKSPRDLTASAFMVRHMRC